MKKNKDHEARWREAIAQAQLFLKKKQANQFEVAKLALNVCEITRGGRHYGSLFTLKRFASEIGITYATIKNWVAMYRLVGTKVDQGLLEQASFSQVGATAQRVTHDSSPSEVAAELKKQISFRHKENIVLRYIADVRALGSTFADYTELMAIDKQILEEAKFFLERAIKNLDSTHTDKIKAQNHYLCSALNNSQRVTLTDAFGVSKDMRLTQKDSRILGKIKENPKVWHSPTAVGLALGKTNTHNNASVWACRSLNKLRHAGFVERNERGLYRYLAKKPTKGVSC